MSDHLIELLMLTAAVPLGHALDKTLTFLPTWIARLRSNDEEEDP